MPELLRSVALVSAVISGAALVQPMALYQRAMAHTDGHAFAAGEPGNPKKPFRVIEITMTDGPGTMTFSPDRIQVRKGEQIKFVLKNTGYLPHEFLIDSFEQNAKHKLEMEEHPGMEHHEPNGRRVDSKKSDEILWRFTKAGAFEFACLIPGHYEAGMKGAVVVK